GDFLLFSQYSVRRGPDQTCAFATFDSIVNLVKCRQSSIDFLHESATRHLASGSAASIAGRALSLAARANSSWGAGARGGNPSGIARTTIRNQPRSYP